MNEFEKNKYIESMPYQKRIVALAKKLGWKFDLLDAQKYPSCERRLIVLHNKAKICINFGYPYCKENYKKTMQVSASLSILGKHIRRIGFSLKRPVVSLVKDINTRLIYDLDDKFKKLNAKREKIQNSDNIFTLRKQSFETLLNSYNDNTCLEYHRHYDRLNSVSPDVIIEAYEKKPYRKVIKVVLSKNNSNVDVVVNSINESLAAKIIDLVKKENKND